jgi:hypothetical protein
VAGWASATEGASAELEALPPDSPSSLLGELRLEALPPDSPPSPLAELEAGLRLLSLQRLRVSRSRAGSLRLLRVSSALLRASSATLADAAVVATSAALANAATVTFAASTSVST